MNSGELINIPSDLIRVGVTAQKLLRFNAERGLYGPGDADVQIAARLKALTSEDEPSRVKLHPSGEVIEIRSARMPDGSLVTTYTDVTAQVAAEESLEKRVAERTEELMRVNLELALAKAQAEDANISKTRFLAAASHDLLQPLNAARLYATSLSEGAAASRSAAVGEMRKLAHNVDLSLEAVEEILTTILEISRLDARALKPELHAFAINDVLEQLRIEFEPMAGEKESQVEGSVLFRTGFIGSPLAASAPAQSRVQRSEIYAVRRTRSRRRTPAPRRTSARGLGHGCRHSAGPA